MDLCRESLSSRQWNERMPGYKWNVSVKVRTLIPLTHSPISSPFWFPAASIFLWACHENMRRHGRDTGDKQVSLNRSFNSILIFSRNKPLVQSKYFFIITRIITSWPSCVIIQCRIELLLDMVCINSRLHKANAFKIGSNLKNIGHAHLWFSGLEYLKSILHQERLKLRSVFWAK